MGKSDKSRSSANEEKQSKQAEKLKQEKLLKVKRQISDLKELISDIQAEIDLITFSEYERSEKLSSVSHSAKHSKVKNVDDVLESDLFKFQGFYCAKFVNDEPKEYVFNFSPSSDSHAPYAVQLFFTNKQTAKSGKWVLPWGIDIEFILEEAPLEKLSDGVNFLRNCKRHVDCHADRSNQFEQLKNSTSKLKNFQLESTLGFRTIYCRFIGAHDKSADKPIDLNVSLTYHSGRVRPNMICVQSPLENSDSELQEMKSFMKSFKTMTLLQAFEKIQMLDHPGFSWTPIEDTADILPVTDSDRTVEGSHIENELHSSGKTTKRKRTTPASPESERDQENLKKTTDTHNETKNPRKPGRPPGKARKKNLRRIVEHEPRQTELSFKGLPVTQTPTSSLAVFKKPMLLRNAKKNAITSTPTSQNLRSGKQLPFSPPEISPIVSDNGKKLVKGKKRVSKRTKK